MAKRKIAILGGGMAGLAAAYDLSKTRELREAFEVTVYQMGWRLGGKCASGRDGWGRIQEHGLHFWFGCYENSFRMLRQVYASVKTRPDNPLRLWSDALKPQCFTPIGLRTEERHALWPLTWPLAGGTPGDGGLFPHPIEMLKSLVAAFKALVEYSPEMRGYLVDGQFSYGSSRLSDATGVLQSIFRTLSGNADSFPREHLDGIIWLFSQAWESIKPGRSSLRAQPLAELLHLGSAFVRGLIIDLIVKRKAVDDLADIDFRGWLVAHGADADTVRNSTVIRAFYDTVMQYQEGDIERPSMAASAAIVVWLRMLCTTKGAMMWELQTAMGEAVIAPIYLLLVQNGVSFKFFRRVDRLRLSSDRRRVQNIHLSRQVNLKRGDYRPTMNVAGLVCWPSQPHWDQIEEGERMRACRADFESRWCQWPSAGHEVLQLEKDFHEVVLAISLGAFMKLNDEASLAGDLIGANDAFRAMTRQIGLIPTQAMQIWCKHNSARLGWKARKAAAVATPAPFGVWADMSQYLRFEGWGPSSTPASVHYFCGPFESSLYRRPASDATTPEAAHEQVRRGAIRWLRRNAPSMLPNMINANGRFNWELLHTPNGARGMEKFDDQYWRANVDPTDCCPGSAAGATKYRLAADASGFDNVYLAGCWVRTGLNTTSVESAVMAGMQSARAICGGSGDIWGEELTFRRR